MLFLTILDQPFFVRNKPSCYGQAMDERDGPGPLTLIGSLAGPFFPGIRGTSIPQAIDFVNKELRVS
jgi:hypothetical protein